MSEMYIYFLIFFLSNSGLLHSGIGQYNVRYYWRYNGLFYIHGLFGIRTQILRYSRRLLPQPMSSEAFDNRTKRLPRRVSFQEYFYLTFFQKF